MQPLDLAPGRPSPLLVRGAPRQRPYPHVARSAGAQLPPVQPAKRTTNRLAAAPLPQAQFCACNGLHFPSAIHLYRSPLLHQFRPLAFRQCRLTYVTQLTEPVHVLAMCLPPLTSATTRPRMPH